MGNYKGTVGILTLGCKVNQYESEAIGELFEARGFHVIPHTEVCDIYVVNTCTVTAESDRKAGQMIRRLAAKNPEAYILVTGCLAQTALARVASLSHVDYVGGNGNKTELPEAAEHLFLSGQKNKEPQIAVTDIMTAPFEPMQIRKFERTRAYIKIEDGCESRCTYCIIPAARGPIRSKPMADVLCEVEALTKGGTCEVVLTGIETASYGKDLENGSLAELLELVDRIPSIGRVRLGSLDPSLMKQGFVDRIASLPSLCPHFHISMQSGSDKTLVKMKRKYNRAMALEGIARLRRAMPHVMLTTDMIVGFPGETDADFEETLSFAREARFLMIHVFPYSKRAGTPAAAMEDQVPESVKKERVSRLSRVADEIREEILSEWLGENRTARVLFEEYKNGYALGHTSEFIHIKVPSDKPLDSLVADVRPLAAEGEFISAVLI